MKNNIIKTLIFFTFIGVLSASPLTKDKKIEICYNGDGNMCSDIGIMYDVGHGEMEQNSIMAIKYFEKSCNLESAQGCLLLGMMYIQGKGVKKSRDNALIYFKKSCELNNKRGCRAYYAF
jgi:TPR repeat protein